IDTDERNIDAWADRLPLLGVCRGWREVATSLVYCNAILDGSSKYGLGFVEHSHDTAVEDKLVNTNIGLVKATGNTHLVKTVTINIDHFEYYRSLIAEANSIFSFKTSDWSRVSTLNISGYLKNDNNDIGSESQSDIMDNANEFTRQMANNQPFTLAESAESAEFTQLTTLNINMNHMQYIPHVCCQKLQTLVLSNVTSMFSWSKLANTKHAETIVFSSLRELDFELDESSDVQSIWSSGELQFPALRNLSVTVPTFAMLKEFMDFKVLKCPHVTELCIGISEFNNEDSDDDFNISMQRSKNLAASIKQHIPSFSRELVHLSLNLELNTLQSLPNVLFETLEYLHLDNVHPTFAWEKMLKNNSTAEAICFKRLESLNIKYSNNIENEEDSESEYIALECQQFISSQKEQQKKQSTLNALCPRLKNLWISNATVPRLQKIMRCGSDQWPCVRSVDIWFQKYDISNVLDIIDSNEYMQATSAFAEYIVKAMPNVNNLTMRSFGGSNKHLKQFCSVVSNGYAYQLISYDCSIPFVWTANAFSPELRHLSFRHLKNAYIYGSHSMLNLLGNTSKARIDGCKININLNSDADLDAFYEATNAFFGSSTKISHAELRLSIKKGKYMCLQKWDSRRIEWTNLHILKIRNVFKLGAVVDMLARVPKITKLEVIAILFDEAFEPRLDRVEPISTNINELYLHTSIDGNRKGAEFDNIKYLILAVPSLKKFTFSIDEDFDHASFVKEYNDLHPHVANIAWEQL
ncbi:hypothetical protein LPJ66_008241, partial [Kickxella alabastrina]